MPSRTALIGQPVRRWTPVIQPSRGPGPRLVVRYSPLPMPMMAIPTSTNTSRTTVFSGDGSTSTMTWSDRAMTTALLMVPSPGRSRSGIHSSSTVTLTRKVATPIDIGSRVLRPWARTVHGALPRVDDTSSASPVPKIHSPRSSRPNVDGRVRQRDSERHRVTGTVCEGRRNSRRSRTRAVCRTCGG